MCMKIQSHASVHVVCLNWLQLHSKLALDLQELQRICSSHADAQVCVCLFLPSCSFLCDHSGTTHTLSAVVGCSAMSRSLSVVQPVVKTVPVCRKDRYNLS